MKLYIKSILSLGVIITMAMTSCKKENISLENNFPDVPVTVTNKIGIFTAPAVSTSFGGGGAIKIVLEIPASSGRTIKEITRVAAGTSYGSVQTTTGLYFPTPIAGNGTTSITFNTTLDEYVKKTNTLPANVPTLATSGTATSFLARNFYFMITLDNGQVIVPTYVRVYVDK
ncbi:hypothetical protein [Pedobacter cryoconitis]|uniref:Uncharacterized protein n=1 Tax=Pedobacter cryoconitis TaxID=188932 RepID=A0A327T179_9SPHI|nr:hypothetical protein [Pedobacter cryoconitis]RAJ34215.1 hypothetical protein LY11_01107 [Pedobacter cryoconitis]